MLPWIKEHVQKDIKQFTKYTHTQNIHIKISQITKHANYILSNH